MAIELILDYYSGIKYEYIHIILEISEIHIFILFIIKLL